MVKKSAFTLIELIFAIMIISIAVLSLPVVSQIMNKGIESGVEQEAIFAVATQLHEGQTPHWDENSLETYLPPSAGARVIDMGTCDNNTSSPYYRLMPGHINQPYHRRCLDSNATSIAHTSTTDVEAVEDKAHGYEGIVRNPTIGQTSYKHMYYTKVDVDINANFAGATNSNIKRITVTISKTNPPVKQDDIICSLKTYTSNIGEPDYYKREY